MHIIKDAVTPGVHYSRACVIGRMEPPHLGHFNLIQHALARADKVDIVLGSSFHAPTSRNPFSWRERMAMLKLMFPTELHRMRFLPIRDYYNGDRWADEVRAAVMVKGDGGMGADTESIVLVGHRKDYTSEYLDWFPDWELEDVVPQSVFHATDIRNVYFESKNLPAALAVLEASLHPDVLAYLASWARLPAYANLVAEHTKLQSEQAKWATAPYAVNHVAADAILECGDHVALIRRKHAPGRGLLAMPGGFVNNNETVREASIREAQEETNIGIPLAQLRHAQVASEVFDYPQRSSRGRVITHAFHYKLNLSRCPEISGNDDAEWAGWVLKSDLAALEDQFHDDHFHILNHFFNIA